MDEKKKVVNLTVVIDDQDDDPAAIIYRVMIKIENAAELVDGVTSAIASEES